MRVLHISCVAPPETGGIGRVAAIESELLRERGVDSVVLAPTRPGMFASSSIERVASSFALGHGAFISMHELKARCAAADVVHFHYPFHGTDALIAHLRRTGIIRRLVVTAHMDASAGGVKGFIFAAHRLLLQPYVLNAADLIFVSSMDYARHSSFRALLRSANAPPVVELPFGVDPERFHPAPAGRPGRTVLFVGGMDVPHTFKGVDVLLKAMARLPPDVRCILAGDGSLRPGYEDLAERLGISDRVTFLGRVSDAELPDVYRQGTVLAFPSTSVAEAFGLVALEAQASGLPVVASDLPGVRTVVKHNETGLLVKPKDPLALAEGLRRILDDVTWREHLAQRARERVMAEYSWQTHGDRLLAAYQDLCASPS